MKPTTLALVIALCLTWGAGASEPEDSEANESSPSPTLTTSSVEGDSQEVLQSEEKDKKKTEKRAPAHMTAVLGANLLYQQQPYKHQQQYALGYQQAAKQTLTADYPYRLMYDAQPLKQSHPLQYALQPPLQTAPMLLLMHPSGHFVFLLPLPTHQPLVYPQPFYQPAHFYHQQPQPAQFYNQPQPAAFYYPQKAQQAQYTGAAVQHPEGASSPAKNSAVLAGEQYVKG